MSHFDLRVKWLPVPDGATAFGPERTTWAQLEIRLLGEPLTNNHPADWTNGDQPFVVGGMAELADWTVEHWLAICWESHTPFAKVGPIQGGGGQARFPSRRDAQSGWADFVVDDDSITGSDLGAWQQRHTVGETASDATALAGGKVEQLRTQYGISKSAAEWHVANRFGSADA